MKILIAIDGSDFSQAALQSVIARPWPPDTEAKVLNVVEPPSLLMGREMGGYDPEFEVVCGWDDAAVPNRKVGGLIGLAERLSLREPVPQSPPPDKPFRMRELD